MKTHWSLSPTALLRRTEATEESTPPETAQSTLPLIVWPRAPLAVSSRKFDMRPPFLAPQTLKTKLERIASPLSVWATSGWNWTPNCRPSADWTAANGELSLTAEHGHALPGASWRSRCGSSSTRSCPGRSRRRGPDLSSILRLDLPYSRREALCTSPPCAWTMSW